MRTYPFHAARMFSTDEGITPLMVHPAKARVIAQAVGPQILGAPVQIAAPQAGILGEPIRDATDWDDEPEMKQVRRVGNVAVLEIEGTLVAKGKWTGAWSGMTSYEGIHAQVSELIADDSVAGVVMEVDSYGGEVDGVFDCADHIRVLAEKKPIVAILTDTAVSAGYLLASPAREIIIPRSGMAGSIGVITMHVDVSQALDAAGYKVTILAAGKNKADGNPYEPLPDDVAEKFRAEMEMLRGLFAEAVGNYRGARLTKAMALATEAECYLGQTAVDAGLADVVANPTEAFRAFVDQMAVASTSAA